MVFATPTLRLVAAWMLSLAAASVAAADDARLTRGPYLQLGTTTGMTIVWRTSGATKPIVRYGAAPDKLNQTVAAAE